MAGEPQALSSLQLVPFRDVLDNLVQEAHSGLQQLAEQQPGLPDEERKRQLLQHLQTTRQRLQRLHVCAQWAHKAKAVNTCREVLKASQDHSAAFVHAADELFRLHEELRFCSAPLFDVGSALHIMQTGTYRLLPSVIEDELQQPGQRLERPGEADERQRAEQRRAALRRLDFLLRSKLLAAELPAGLRVQRVRGGQAAVLGSRGQYSARLTLVPAPADDVTLAKYRPAGEGEVAAAIKEEPEVAQPSGSAAEVVGAAAEAQPSANAGGAAAEAEQRQGTAGWRWQLLSFELLPGAAGLEPPLLLPQQRQWLQQHLEQRMWAAADVERLAGLGRAAWLTVPTPPPAAREQQQQGRTASAPVPSSSQAPSQQPADSRGKAPALQDGPDRPQPSTQQGAEAAAQQRQPQGAATPLAVMHGILCQTAGRLALFSTLLSDARQLEGGSWRGCLKLSRAASGSGIRLAYWLQLPVAGFEEVQCLQEGRPYQQPTVPAAAATRGAQQQEPPVVEVSLREDGSLAATCHPQLQHPLSGEAVPLPLPLDNRASLSADRLLLRVAASAAAVQLAAVQAVLRRGGRLEAADVHPQLVLRPDASGAGVSASPQLQLWSGGLLQLCLTVQLRSGRLLLAAGPALLESEQGGSAAAAAAAVAQQLEAAQRDALTQPLPAGTSRGMLAARLVAAALERLSLQLRARQLMDAAAAEAARCGLRRTSLPQRLLQQHLSQVAPLAPCPSPNALTLALAAFPPPPDMQQWARQQRLRAAGGGAGAAADTGATRCFLVLDFGAAAALPAPAQGADGAQPRGSPPVVLLALCSCTSRGTPTRVQLLSELPPEVVLTAQLAAAEAAAVAAAPGGRKRKADDGPASGSDGGLDGAASSVPAGTALAGGGGGGGAGLDLSVLAAWCRRQASWLALRAQGALLPVRYAEELPLGPCQLAGRQRALRLPKAPVLGELEAWAAAQLGGGPGAQRRPAATLRLEGGEEGCGAGAWRLDVASRYFGDLPRLLARSGVAAAPPAADVAHVAAHESGLTMRYSLQKGHSVLTAVTDMLRVSMLHLALTRLVGCMAANPLAAGYHAAAAAAPAAASDGSEGGGANGGPPAAEPAADFLADSPEPAAPAAAAAAAGEQAPVNGGLSNGVPPPPPPCNGTERPGERGLAWPLPGCGPVRLREAGLSHLTLSVEPPPQPELADGQPGAVPLQASTVTVSWGSAQQAAADGGGRGALPRTDRCCVAAEPPLPGPVAAALAQQLQAGRADLFLDSLCLAAHSAAAAAAQLTPAAQRTAGLLPGALQLLGLGGSAAAGEGAAASAQRLRARLQQGERGALLALTFCAAGCTLLQLQPLRTATATAAAAGWMPQLWRRLAERVPTFRRLEPDSGTGAPDGGQQPSAAEDAPKRQAWQAWVHCSFLGAALAEVLAAVGAQPADAADAAPAPT